MFGEKRLNMTLYRRGDWHDDAGWSDGWDPDIIRTTTFGIQKDVPTGVRGYEFGGAHPGGMNACFADGSVRNLTYTITPLFVAVTPGMVLTDHDGVACQPLRRDEPPPERDA